MALIDITSRAVSKINQSISSLKNEDLNIINTLTGNYALSTDVTNLVNYTSSFVVSSMQHVALNSTDQHDADYYATKYPEFYKNIIFYEINEPSKPAKAKIIIDGPNGTYEWRQIGGGGGSLDSQTDPIYAAQSSQFVLKTELPTIPSKTSDLTNDSGFITNADLNGFATTSQVNSTSTYLSGAIDQISGVVNELPDKNYISNYVSGALTDYSTIEYVTGVISSFATTGWVDQNYLKEHQSLTGYYNKDQISGISGKITSWVDADYVKISDFEITSGELTGGITQVRNSLTGYVELSTLEETSGILNNSITGLTANVKQISGYFIDLSGDVDQISSYVSGLPSNINQVSGVVSGLSTYVYNLSTSQITNDIGYITGVNLDGYLSSQMVDNIDNVSAEINTFFYTSGGNAAIYNTEAGLIKLSNPILSSFDNNTQLSGNELATVSAIIEYTKIDTNLILSAINDIRREIGMDEIPIS